MVEFLLAAAMVLVGAFLLFAIVVSPAQKLGHARSVATVIAAVAFFCVFAVHRYLIGSGISQPFFTATLVLMAFSGLNSEQNIGPQMRKSLLIGGIVGGLLGWATYIQVVSVGNAKTYHGYPCTQDCNGREAGYAWAERHNITDQNDCGEKS